MDQFKWIDLFNGTFHLELQYFSMNWYDIFSNIYDTSLEKLYRYSRVRATEFLDPRPGQVILDLACGTGANFEHLKAACESVRIVGTDLSDGMLNKAKARVEKNGWKNIELFQSDARSLNDSLIGEKIGGPLKFDAVICVLGLSVIPEWERVLDRMLDLLKRNGRIVVVDVFAEKRTANTWLVEKFARADLNRTIWQTMEERTSDFQKEYLPVKESQVGGKLFVATGLLNKANTTNTQIDIRL